MLLDDEGTRHWVGSITLEKELIILEVLVRVEYVEYLKGRLTVASKV